MIRTLEDQLDPLRQKPCHANRDRHFDHVVVANLLAFFNPALQSRREIEDVFQDRRVRKRFGTPRVPESTLSDAPRVFDPQRLLPLMADLKARDKIQPHDPRLAEIAAYDPKGEPLRLPTDRLDLSAELIGLLYKHRRQVELFFRRLKCLAGFKLSYSESPEGITLQVYMAIIGALLIALGTGARPSGPARRSGKKSTTPAKKRRA